jgi:hypothetical protein
MEKKAHQPSRNHWIPDPQIPRGPLCLQPAELREVRVCVQQAGGRVPVRCPVHCSLIIRPLKICVVVSRLSTSKGDRRKERAGRCGNGHRDVVAF